MNNPNANRLVTVQDILDAIERNGYRQSKSGWFNHKSPYTAFDIYGTKENPIIEACFMGQIAINLGVSHVSLSSFFSDLDLWDAIVERNDEREWSYSAIKRYVVPKLKKNINYPGRQMKRVPYVAIRKGEKI